MALAAKVDQVDTRVAVHMGIVLDLAVSSIAAEVAAVAVVARGPAHPALFARAGLVAKSDQVERWDHRDTSTIPHLSLNNTVCIAIRNYEEIAEY